MKIDGAVALVTGANRGLGEVYARELVARGRPTWTPPGPRWRPTTSAR